MKLLRPLALASAALFLLAGCGSSGSSASSGGATSIAGSAATTAPPTTVKHKDVIGNDAFRAKCVTVKDQASLDIVEPACAYLLSLLTHDGSKIPLAPHAWRIEQGVNTGNSGPAIQKANEGAAFSVISNVRDFRWYISGKDEGIVYYTLDIKGVPTIKSVLLAERFKVVNRLITQIEVVFYQCATTVVNAQNPTGADMCPKS